MPMKHAGIPGFVFPSSTRFGDFAPLKVYTVSQEMQAFRFLQKAASCLNVLPNLFSDTNKAKTEK